MLLDYNEIYGMFYYATLSFICYALFSRACNTYYVICDTVLKEKAF